MKMNEIWLDVFDRYLTERANCIPTHAVHMAMPYIMLVPLCVDTNVLWYLKREAISITDTYDPLNENNEIVVSFKYANFIVQ